VENKSAENGIPSQSLTADVMNDQTKEETRGSDMVTEGTPFMETS
jgi:hypothetical protein